LTPRQNTSHLFVETNWLYGYAAPAHHQLPEAVALLERAQRGDFILYIPNVSFAEARQSIQMKCQPVDGPGIHRYIRWAHRTGELNDERAEHAHRLAERYVQQVRDALSGVPTILRDVAGLSCVKVFALDDEMLDLATELALEKVAQKPFDHAIMAGILVYSSRLWNRGERRISFAERDSDLQPWGGKGAPKDDLRKLYENAHVWVYGDFTLEFPPRPTDFQ
jgi:predicted nucleic acid-binding protein